MEEIACEMCGAGQYRLYFCERDLTHHVTDEEFRVVRCDGCGLLYVNPRPPSSEIGRYYPKQYFGPPSPPRRFSRMKRWIMEDFYGYPSTMRHSVLQRLRKVLLWPEHVRRALAGMVVMPWVGRGRLLDVGCGSGTGTVIFKVQGWEVYGLDLNEVAVGYARQLLGERVELGDFRTVRYPDRAFDVVRLSHTLEHMYGLSDVFAEVHRILDDDGMVAVTVPNAGSWEAKLLGRWWFPWELPRHLYHFEPATLTRLLDRQGFEVQRWFTGVTPAHFMTSLERVWKEKFGAPLKFRELVEKALATPFCLLAGHLGYGTEVTAYAKKKGGASWFYDQ